MLQSQPSNATLLLHASDLVLTNRSERRSHSTGMRPNTSDEPAAMGKRESPYITSADNRQTCAMKLSLVRQPSQFPVPSSRWPALLPMLTGVVGNA